MAKKSDDTAKGTRMAFERPNKSSNLSMGIVGLPNVGKSTLFNRLTRSSVPAENYPFCTINATTGHVKIEDPRVNFLESIYKPKRVVNAFLSVVDIAGLVRGASEGQGLGNQFLDNIRNVDGIFLVVRCFEDKEIIHVENSIDPLRDIEIIKGELRSKDKEMVEKAIVKVEKEIRAKPNDKKVEKNLSTAKRLLEILETRWINEESYDLDEMMFINGLSLLTTKTVVILANIPSKNYEARTGNKHLKVLIETYKDLVIPFSATHYKKREKGESDKKSEKGESDRNKESDMKRESDVKEGMEKMSVTKRDESVTKRDESVTKRDESVTKRDESVTKRDESVTKRESDKENKVTSDNYTVPDNTVPDNNITSYIPPLSENEPFDDDLMKKIVSKGYKALNLMNYFTAGKDEVKSWTIQGGMKAPSAGGVIHSDFERYFVCAEVMEFEEFEKHPSEGQMRAAGKYLQKGKEYVVKDGDIILFKFNAPKGGKK